MAAVHYVFPIPYRRLVEAKNCFMMWLNISMITKYLEEFVKKIVRDDVE
ncbi:MAG: hypothetical protein QXI36_03590 [Candidatus Bathyarchaeia archaeon]